MLNRTIASPNTTSPVRENLPQDSRTIDPELRGAGLSVIERRQEMQQAPSHPWRPPHSATGPGGRADEYLISGDDTGKPAYIVDWTVHNFNAGSTIAHFDTLDGRVIVEPSNRVHIYAPRFGAIRKVEGLMGEGQVTALTGTQGQQIVGQRRDALQAGFTEQEVSVLYGRTQDQVQGIEGQRRGAGVGTTLRLAGYGSFQVVDSSMLLQRVFATEGSIRAELERGATNARAWAGSEGVRVQMNVLAPMSASSVDAAAVYFQIEDDQSRTSQLRLIKVASLDSASPGDIVEFTLRFDNIGNQLVGNVTILDDLISRLEFLPGTAVSSLPSGFSTQPNAHGGLTLRFEITEPLAPGEFGVIQFQCRVR
jgi:uncharacterized repeat protein (TIGR01451 family)